MARLAFLATAAAVLSTAVTAYRPGDEVCVVGPDNTCPLDKIPVSKTDGSTLIYPGGKTRCAFDNWSSPSSNYSTNATFFFQVFPTAEKKDKTKLLLYLQGGGACIDSNTCSFAMQCSSSTQTFQPNARALSLGILNRSEPSNVFNDWNIVHVPYCTGDIHVGNTVHAPDATAEAIFPAVFQATACQNQNQTTHQNGYVNALSAFDWALANFPDVEHLALSGSSAGALGAQMYAKFIADKWKVDEKKIHFSVLSDSYVGVVPDSNPAGALINYYNSCSLPVSIPQKVVTMCLNNSGTVVDLMSPIIKETSSADWFFADSMADKTQRLFYEMFRQGILSFPFTNTISAEDFYNNMTAILDAYENDTAKIGTFFETGDRHVFFTLNNWTSIPSSDGKTTLGVVVRDILAGNFSYEHSGSKSSPSGSTSAPTASASASLKALASIAFVVVATVLAW